jgi:deoxyribodipyrimidine photo-lyase
MVADSRILRLNDKATRKGEFVLYWMQSSQRTEYNQALEFAIHQANEIKLPLLVYFALTDEFPEANERHYRFMLEGILQVRQSLYERGIGMVIQYGSPESGVTGYSAKAALVVCDCGYLKIQKQWRYNIAQKIACPLIQVESDVIVPVEVASGKEEYSAATFRRKIMKVLPRYLVPVEQENGLIDSTKINSDSIQISNVEQILRNLKVDRSVKPVNAYHGGTPAAKKRLREFISHKLEGYADFRNDPGEDYLSNLSPYLHFGQISPLYIALEISRYGEPGSESFLEELIVRRELSMNYVHYNQKYDSFEGLPDWAKRTLSEHQSDSRQYLYSSLELEKATTHDAYWNAAQREMVATGKMHGYMRMYWGKKILEWTAQPQEAFRTALQLNNKYELDGRDPNGFTGVAWCFGKHDRPWGGRIIFGNVRYMSAAGLKRKFDMEKYIRRHTEV